MHLQNVTSEVVKSTGYEKPMQNSHRNIKLFMGNHKCLIHIGCETLDNTNKNQLANKHIKTNLLKHWLTCMSTFYFE